MRSRRLLCLALSVLTGAAALVALPGAVGPAYADVQPCTVSYATTPNIDIPAKGSNPSHSFVIVAFDVTDRRVVTDLSLSLDITHPQGGSLNLHLHGSKSVGLSAMQAHNAGQSSGAWNGRYVFDEETGAAPVSGPNPAPGTYRPASPEAVLEGAPAYPGTDSWNLWVLNYADVQGTMRGATLTLTYATCDSDGDGVEDAADNCPTVANDQANHDDDALGDACDRDLDGDRLANDLDGCPSVAAPTRTGCPTARRTASVSFAKSRKRLVVAVRSRAPGCRADAEVTLRRKKPGRDTSLVVATTNARGRYVLKAPRRPGRYYVTVARSYAPGEAECAAARSKPKRVSTRAALPRTARTTGPDTDGDGQPDATDGCPAVASDNPTGCPTVSRRARLRYLADRSLLQATITSTATACSSRSRVKLWRVKRRGDVRVEVATSSFAGRHRFTVRRGARYYVTVSSSYAPGTAECASVTSRTVRVPNR